MSCEPSSESRSSEVIVKTGVCGRLFAEVSGAIGAIVVSDCAQPADANSVKQKGSALFMRRKEVVQPWMGPRRSRSLKQPMPPFIDPAAVGLSRARQM